MTESIFLDIAENIDTRNYDEFYEDPPSFADFVRNPKYLGQQPLFARQERILLEALGSDPRKYFSEDKTITTIVLEWGKGCIADNAFVLNGDGVYVPLHELSDDILAFDLKSKRLVEAVTAEPFISGKGPIFYVETRDGGSIEVYEHHLFYGGTAEYLPLSRGLNPDWVTLSALNVGDYVLRVSLEGNLFWDKITKIKYLRHDYYFDLDVPDYNSYVANGFISHNSGKDLVVSYLIAYFTYLLLNTRRLHDYFGVARDDYMDVIVVAASQKQATNTLFKRISKWIQRPVFSKFNPKVLSQEIHFDVGLRIFSFHSKAETYEGYSPIMWVMAEASAFKDSAEKSNAEHVFNVLSSSARSRFKNRWIGFVTSYPRGEGDFIERYYETSQRRVDWWGDKAASWEVRDDRTIDDYMTDLEENPEFAWTVYGCKPSTGYGKWFGDRRALEVAFKSNLRSEVTTRQIRTTRTTSSGTREYLGLEITSYNPRNDYSYIAHGDPGLATDSFSLTIARLGPGVDRNLGLPVVDVVAILVWLPDKHRGLNVDFVNVKDIIIQLDRIFSFSQVTFDQWNSAMLIQQLLDAGVNAFDMSFSVQQQIKMYRNLRTMINNGLVRIVDNDLAFRELRDLESTSSKPNHSDGGSKDIADGVASVCWFIAQEFARENNGFLEFLKHFDEDNSLVCEEQEDDKVIGVTASGVVIRRR